MVGFGVGVSGAIEGGWRILEGSWMVWEGLGLEIGREKPYCMDYGKGMFFFFFPETVSFSSFLWVSAT